MREEEERKTIISLAKPILTLAIGARKEHYARIMSNPWDAARSRNIVEQQTTSLLLQFAKEEVRERPQCVVDAIDQVLEATELPSPDILRSIFHELYDSAAESDIERCFEQQIRPATGAVFPNPTYPPLKASFETARTSGVNGAIAKLNILATKRVNKSRHGHAENMTNYYGPVSLSTQHVRGDNMGIMVNASQTGDIMPLSTAFPIERLRKIVHEGTPERDAIDTLDQESRSSRPKLSRISNAMEILKDTATFAEAAKVTIAWFKAPDVVTWFQHLVSAF